jgi:hypothetical protein
MSNKNGGDYAAIKGLISGKNGGNPDLRADRCPDQIIAG